MARPPPCTEPLSYYHRSGPIGDVVASLRERRRLSEVAVVGLGTGAMACHSRRGERWTFYEIDPTVERIARDPRFFTYLRDCAGTFDVVLGDARLSLRRSARRRFGLLIADAFTSDAIPVHLLTREALDLYRARLDPTGVVAFHVSNRYVDLEPVLGALARQAGLACRSRFDEARGRAAAPGRDASHWVALAAQPGHLGRVASAAAWRACRSGGDAWTDDYSNLAGALRLGGGTVEDSSLTPAARLRRP